MWAIYEDGNLERITGKSANAPPMTNSFNMPEGRLSGSSCPTTARKSRHCCTRRRAANPARKCPASCTSPAWTASKKTTRPAAIRSSSAASRCYPIDCPGHGETREGGIKCTASNVEDAGKLAADYLVKRPEIDADRLGVMASSMGSYWAPRVVAAEKRFKACAVSGVCMEPGQFAIFNMSSPTFKLNYMYMSGYDDEAAFDEFCKSLSLRRRHCENHLSLYGCRRRRRRALRHEVRL